LWTRKTALCVSGQTDSEPGDGYSSYFVACMIIRSVEERKLAAKEAKKKQQKKNK
jgi:hypothetical protein